MPQRRLLWAGAVLLALGGLGWLLLWSDPAIHVRQGMTVQEVDDKVLHFLSNPVC